MDIIVLFNRFAISLFYWKVIIEQQIWTASSHRHIYAYSINLLIEVHY